MSADDDEARSNGVSSVVDDILDQYRFHFEPEYRVKFKKELSGFRVSAGVYKPHQAPTRLRFTLKPPYEASGCSGARIGRFVQKVLLLPQQSFLALYSSKLAWGFLRCQFVAGYFWDRRVPSLDYRLSTKWNDGFRFKRKEYYQPTKHLLMRAKWNLDMQLPDVEGHLGGAEDSMQVPMDVEYGSMDFSVVQLDWVVDLDGFPEEAHTRLLGRPRAPKAVDAGPSGGAGSGARAKGAEASGELGAVVHERGPHAQHAGALVRWPWHHHHGDGER